MLLPKQIIALKRIIARATGRHAYSSVRVERGEDGPRAMATDGRRAVVFTWDEPPADQFPPVEGMSRAPARRFAANVPPGTLAEAGRGLPRRPRRGAMNPALAHLLLDESDPSLVRVAAGGDGKVTRAQANADEGGFPDCDAVLPAPVRDGTLYDPGRHGKAPFTHTRIGVNARQFAETLKVLSDLAADDANHTVVMTVPVDPGRPIRLDARCDGRRAAAAVMPVGAEFAAYNEAQQAQRPAPLPALPPPGAAQSRVEEPGPASGGAPAGTSAQRRRGRARPVARVPRSPPPRQSQTP